MLLRSLLVWCGLVLAAIANAGVRETWISRNFGEPAGHALSTASLCAVILLVTWFSIRWLRPVRPRGAILIGTLWLALTIAFEFFAGHYAYGVRWSDLFADYNLARGRVFVFVPMTTFIAPLWTAYWRGLLGFSHADRPPPAKEGEINFAMFDRFSFAHLGIGLVYGLFGFGPAVAMVLAVLWEVVENCLKAGVPALFPSSTRDTYKNSIGDILAVATGWVIVYYLRGG